jgi:CelD/BcsL family acetyltransferase involved in cellulose biosynthesis
MFPSDGLAAFWAEQHRGDLTAHRAWGLPLVREGAVLHSAGKGDFPDVFADPDAPAGFDGLDAAALVVHDVADDDGQLARLLAQAPRARAYLRYECGAAVFGDDPGAYMEEHLSTKRRKSLRYDRRQLERDGELAVRWIGADEADAMFSRFFALVCQRAALSGRYDPNVARRDYLHALWRRFAGDELLVSVLSVGQRAVSFRTGFAVDERFLGYMPAVDRSFSKASMGDVHMEALLPHLAERGLRSYHMGKGARGNKEVWENRTYTLSTLVVPLAGRLPAVREAARQRLRRAVTASGWEDPLRRGIHWGLTRRPTAYRRALDAEAAA